jgi:iron(III) transport system substrate-binding protein
VTIGPSPSIRPFIPKHPLTPDLLSACHPTRPFVTTTRRATAVHVIRTSNAKSTTIRRPRPPATRHRFAAWRRRFAVAVMAGVSATVMGACGTASTSSTTAARSATAHRAAVASASGPVTVYAALTAANGKALTSAFEAADPKVQLSMVTGGTGPLTTRIAAERRAGRVQADVIFLADPTSMDTLAEEHVLSSWRPAVATSMPTGFTGPGWVGALTFENVIAYHDGMKNPPTNWSDLTDPAYKGEIAIGDPSYSGTTFGLVGALSTRYGWSYYRKLKANGVQVQDSTNTVGTEIAQGIVEAGATLDVVVRNLQAKGAKISIAWPTSGAVPVPAPVGVTRDAKNPAAAKAFVTWLLSPKGQAAVVKLGYVPSVPGIDAHGLLPVSAKQMTVNWTKLAADKSTILATFQSIFGG